MHKRHWRRHGRILPIVAGALMLGLPLLAIMAPYGGAARGDEEPDAGVPDPTPHEEATPTATPTPSGEYQLNGIDVTESDNDPDGFFKTSASSGGVSLNANDNLDAGVYGESWLDGSFSKSVSVNYSWSWVTDSDLAPEPYSFSYKTSHTGSATHSATGASTASASGSSSDSIGGNASNGGSAFTSQVYPGALSIGTSLSMTVGGSIHVRAKQGTATGNTSQTASGSVELG